MTVKLVGKRVGLAFLKGRLARIWKPIGEMEVIGMNHGFFVVRFSNSADYNQVFDGGPWMVLGHYLMVQKWEPEFKHAQGELGKVAVWIHVPDFPIEYYRFMAHHSMHGGAGFD